MRKKTIPLVEKMMIDLGWIGTIECIVFMRYRPGTPPMHANGYPEDYDPGEDSELRITAILVDHIDLLPLFQSYKLNEFIDDLKNDLDEKYQDQ